MFLKSAIRNIWPLWVMIHHFGSLGLAVTIIVVWKAGVGGKVFECKSDHITAFK